MQILNTIYGNMTQARQSPVKGLLIERLTFMSTGSVGYFSFELPMNLVHYGVIPMRKIKGKRTQRALRCKKNIEFKI